MAKPKALVLRTAGTNCDVETKYALDMAGADADLVHVNRLAQAADPFGDVRIIAIPGGFTYGDDVASGKVLAVELLHVLGDALQAYVDRGGLVIGICNGFQVLVKTGLLPGARLVSAEERVATLTFNDSHKFESRWVRLRAEANTVCVFAEPGEEIEMPVAHGEGKFVLRHPDMLQTLADAGQVVYRYTTADGGDPVYPADPNGSMGHVAGICDPSGRVFGLMPHPERNLFGYHHPRWTREPRPEEGEGARLFRRAVAYINES